MSIRTFTQRALIATALAGVVTVGATSLQTWAPNAASFADGATAQTDTASNSRANGTSRDHKPSRSARQARLAPPKATPIPTPTPTPTPSEEPPAPPAPPVASAPVAKQPPVVVPPPAPAAPAPTVTGSGAALPTQDLPGWSLTLSEGFDRPAPLGSFSDVYRGWAGYDGSRDTSRNGSYNSATTASVQDGVMRKHLHTAGSSAQVMALTPPIEGQTYGRYAVRFRMDDAPGFKVAWLLWPSSGDWSEGEIDFPEGSVGGNAYGFAHETSGDPSKNAWMVDTETATTEWHTAVIEWTPDRLTFMLDDRSWTTTDRTGIPTTAMDWVLQTETELEGGAPSPGASGGVYIDWVAAWRLA